MGGIKHMNRNPFATSILVLALAGAAGAQSTASSAENGVHYNRAQLKELTLNAHAPAQYAVIASYYGERHTDYLRQAAEEKKEWMRRSQNSAGTFAKYPRPADSARNLYEYYMYKASEAGELEAKFSRLASPDAAMNTH
jgi:hypothetical protein